MILLLFLLLLGLATATVAAKSFVWAAADERLVVLRLGRLLAVQGPGLTVIIPFTDRAVRVKVQMIAGWQGLSEDDLRGRAAGVALRDGR